MTTKSKSRKARKTSTVAAAVAVPTSDDPRQMAVAAVQEWFDSLIENDQAHTHGSIYQVLLEDKFEEVQQALIAEYQREGNPPEEGDEEFLAAVFGRTAGYLIGVQVGLRLRSQGVR